MNESPAKINSWMMRLLLVVSICWVITGINYFRVRSRLGSLWIAELNVHTVDATHGTKLPAWLGGIPSPDKDGLPLAVFLSPSGEGSHHVLVASDKPLVLKVWSEGYETQKVTLSETGNKEIIAQLKKR